MKLSVIIITKNEAHNIGECLQSVAFADELIVLDSGSGDETRAIAAALGARVAVSEDWLGYGPQKNRVLAMATGEWVLSIDADERVSAELAAEIKGVVDGTPQFDAFKMPRSTWYCGKFLKSGGDPDYVVRLFRRGTARFSDSLVHERLVPDGKVGTLSGVLLHYSFRDFTDVLAKIEAYSTTSARQAVAAGRTSSVAEAVGRSLWMFFRTYILKRGFLDGSLGFASAVSAAHGTYYRYIKIWNWSRARDKAAK